MLDALEADPALPDEPTAEPPGSTAEPGKDGEHQPAIPETEEPKKGTKRKQGTKPQEGTEPKEETKPKEETTCRAVNGLRGTAIDMRDESDGLPRGHKMLKYPGNTSNGFQPYWKSELKNSNADNIGNKSINRSWGGPRSKCHDEEDAIRTILGWLQRWASNHTDSNSLSSSS